MSAPAYTPAHRPPQDKGPPLFPPSWAWNEEDTGSTTCLTAWVGLQELLIVSGKEEGSGEPAQGLARTLTQTW